MLLFFKIKEKAAQLYKGLSKKLLPLLFFFKFLLHRYDNRQFNALCMQRNMKVLLGLQANEKVDCSSEGTLKKLEKPSEKLKFELINFFLWGSPQARLFKVVDLTILVFGIELNNPFKKESLMKVLNKKMGIASRLFHRLKQINGREWNQDSALENMKIYEKNSLLQHQIIHWMQSAVSKAKIPPVIQEVREALKKGLYPLLITRGLSGSYWMRYKDRKIAGLFKPFDEELFAPNNPSGVERQGTLGLRKARWGVRVGESAHREVAAYLVDQFFGFGVVPRTYYASFVHHSFFSATEGVYATKRKAKEKMGSFQEFLEGFQSFDELTIEERERVSIEEFQLLIALDMIIGNCDRNMGNILVYEEKIAAVDHGLCFMDVHDYMTLWHLGVPQGRHPFLPALQEVFLQFPFEKLSWKLKKHCFISSSATQRMKERVVLFREGLKANLTPFLMQSLMIDQNLNLLFDLDLTLDQKAKELVEKFCKEKLANLETTDTKSPKELDSQQ